MSGGGENKKLKPTSAESGEDHISVLPDKSLHDILAFLPAQEAVRTSVLSRRWRHVWKSMRILRATEIGDWVAARFNEFVNNLLFLRDLVPSYEFDFTTYHPDYSRLLRFEDLSGEDFRYVEMWIQYALMREVRVLRVLINSSRLHRLAKLPIISSHLMVLELACVELDVRHLDFTRCPVLEKLTMDDSTISSLKLSSQSLRHLCITSCNFSDDYCMLISAPNLCSLRLGVSEGKAPLLGSMPLLVTAHVELSLHSDPCGHSTVGDCSCHGRCYASRDCSCKCLLLGSLSNAIFEVNG